MAAYIAELDAKVLDTDIRVTNFQYTAGSPTPVQSVLQTGSAVLVDKAGVVRVRCKCGNPLTPSRQTAPAEYKGTPWVGFVVIECADEEYFDGDDCRPKCDADEYYDDGECRPKCDEDERYRARREERRGSDTDPVGPAAATAAHTRPARGAAHDDHDHHLAAATVDHPGSARRPAVGQAERRGR